VIPILDLQAQYLALKPELDAAMQRVAASGHYILGPEVKALEQELAAYCDCKHAVGVANGTDALHLALRALKLGPGDEVLTTPFTFIATTEAIGMVGAKPVFVDIDPDTFNLDPKLIEAAITPRTKVILPVHLYGQPCDMDPIMAIARKHGLRVVEDCAQAIGATYKGRKVGSFGDLGCLSFFPSKNLGCFGDGGMVVGNDQALVDRVEMLRRHGGKVKYLHSELGMNSRLDELQAAILKVKLKHLEEWTAARRRIAYRYNELLKDAPGIITPQEIPEVRAVYHQYTVRLASGGSQARDRLQAALKEAGVQTMIYYPVPLHLQEVHADLGLKAGRFPRTEAVAAAVLSLPIFPELAGQDQDVVARELKNLSKV
jgi:dTDP-4-amino-4,6-dideoxygalactose transaminase